MPARRLSRSDIVSARCEYSAQLLEVGDDIGAGLRVVDFEEHFGTGNQRARVGEPAVECEFIPGQTGILQGCGIVVVGNAASRASDHPAMLRSEIIVVNGVTGQASLIQSL